MRKLEYFKGDERPAWEATIIANGVAEDYTAGYTFEVKLSSTLAGPPALIKVDNVVGAPCGLVTVNWDPGELDLPTGKYYAQLRIRRTVDDRDLTVRTDLSILPSL